MSDMETTATRRPFAAGSPGPSGTAYLVVVEDDKTWRVYLPREGVVTIGRGEKAGIQLEHGSVSRDRHAAIHVERATFRVSDLESHNGTRVNGELLQDSRTLSSGDVITCGEVVLVFHASNAVSSRATLGEIGWRRRLVEELERAVTYRRSLAVLVVHGIARSAVRAVAEQVRLIDVVAESERDGALLLMPEADRDIARETAAKVMEALRAAGTQARGGLVVCPDDAADADSMLFLARRGAKAAAIGEVLEVCDAPADVQLGDKQVVVLDPAMVGTYTTLERIAPSRLDVLITGENGVGKENAALAIHHWSKRTGAYITVNCATLDDLAEAKLFGHAKGAFTGAVTAEPGLFEAADGGTLFLDDVNSLPLATQAKLLRVLESGTLSRLGEIRERTVDVRVVSASNQSLPELVAAGQFREDLMFRLARTRIWLPPLRDRRCEIPVLARRFLDSACTANHRAPMQITPEAMQRLLTDEWPGNVRQLRNVVESACVNALADWIELSDVARELDPPSPALAPVPAEPAPQAPGSFRPIYEELRELERTRIVEALDAAEGVRTRAAQLLDMPIRTFTLRLKQYGL